MNRSNNKESLPEGWVKCKSKSNKGRSYYFNKKTGTSSWTRPEASKQNSRKDSKKADKKTLKRKSDGPADTEVPHKKRNQKVAVRKQETKTLQKPKSKTNTSKEHGSPKKLTKNLANKRLVQLQAKLYKEVLDETAKPTLKIPKKEMQQPNTANPQSSGYSKQQIKSETMDIKPNTDIKTEQLENFKKLTSKSPAQFTAMNKILLSIKSKLPEPPEGTVKKNYFANIEEGINNKDYQSIKLPVMTEQFSVASKIVSAMKDTLNKDANTEGVKTYTSAQERMQALRSSLCSENGSTMSSIKTFSKCETAVKPCERQQSLEAMDVDEIKAPSQQLVLVVDTNIFIHELDFVKNVMNSHIKGYSQQPTLLVPWRVINELDRLKDNNNTKISVSKSARSAMDYLYQSLPENDRIKGQTLRDANSHIFQCDIPDDEILNCCIQQVERGKSVILLSNDKNLCNKAVINGIKSYSIEELKKELETQRPQNSDPSIQEELTHCQNSIYKLLAHILENEMRAKYNMLWEHILFKPPPWSLKNVLECLLKHWIAVFNEVFPRIEQEIKDLKAALDSVDGKSQKTLTQSDLDIFRDLCLDIARKCQIIPDYMDLAKITVERILRRTNAEVDTRDYVMEAFEKIWIVYSSYSAKLANGLGVNHNLEDKLYCTDTLDVLVDKWMLFTKHIKDLRDSISGVRDSNATGATRERINRLTTCLKECLNSVSIYNDGVNINNTITFSIRCRDTLEAALVNFSQLSDLLDACGNAISNSMNGNC